MISVAKQKTTKGDAEEYCICLGLLKLIARLSVVYKYKLQSWLDKLIMCA
jgi:hypothetical protein